MELRIVVGESGEVSILDLRTGRSEKIQSDHVGLNRRITLHETAELPSHKWSNTLVTA